MQTTTTASSQRSLRGLLLRRLRDGVIVLLLVVTIIFFLAHVVGNPALVFAPVDATDEQIADIHRQFGLDRPVTERYWEYLTGLARLDFGESTWQQPARHQGRHGGASRPPSSSPSSASGRPRCWG